MIGDFLWICKPGKNPLSFRKTILTNPPQYEKNLAFIFAIIAWFAVIVQFYLMMENRLASVPETIIRFFSFFTILTNTLVAVYFTVLSLAKNQKGFWYLPGTLTAITVYILVVGLVYQFVLRQIWEPEGMQKIVDELLHSVNPVLVLVFWLLYEKKDNIRWNQVPYWLRYPLIYLLYILGRGHFSGFYPYPFVNVAELGIQQVLVNSFFLLLVFLGLSAALVWVGKRTSKKHIGEL